MLEMCRFHSVLACWLPVCSRLYLRRLPSGKPVHKDVSSRSLIRSAKKQARKAERKEKDKPLAQVSQKVPVACFSSIFEAFALVLLVWSMDEAPLPTTFVCLFFRCPDDNGKRYGLL